MKLASEDRFAWREERYVGFEIKWTQQPNSSQLLFGWPRNKRRNMRHGQPNSRGLNAQRDSDGNRLASAVQLELLHVPVWVCGWRQLEWRSLPRSWR